MTPDEIAKKNYFDYAQYIGEYKGMKIYCGAMDDPMAATGWPQHIIKFPDGKIRMATQEENDLFMRVFPEGADTVGE